MDKIIDYLKEKYDPVGLIVYGSFANGTNNLNSDFDALLIYGGQEEIYDNTVVNGIELDVFVYPIAVFKEDYDIMNYVQVWDGRIYIDETGTIAELQHKATACIRAFEKKTDAENQQNLAWCEKMLKRVKRNDIEGYYRMHWLLGDSLQIYYDIIGKYYFGPKKALKEMSVQDSHGTELYFEALKNPTEVSMKNWIDYLKSLNT